MTFLYAFLMAVSLLTRLPVNRYLPQPWPAQGYAMSPVFYPAVGGVLGLLLLLVWVAVHTHATPFLIAAIVLASWVLLTGALHLDGLADSVDAYFAAHKQLDRTLAVMKDPFCGPMAIVAIVVVLLLKVAALTQLLSVQPLLLLPVLMMARIAPILIIRAAKYSRSDQGMASGLATVPLFVVLFWVAACFLLSAILSSLMSAITVFAVCGIVSLVWMRLWQGLIGGYTGDTLGAVIELVETMSLIVFACCLGVPV